MGLKIGSGPLRLGRPGLQIKTGGTFDPTTITGLALWFKADAGLLDASDAPITVDGTAIKTWQDQSGNTKHAVQATGANQPLYKAGITNGKPVVRFDGSNDTLVTPAVAEAGWTTGATVICAYTLKAAGNYPFVITASNGPELRHESNTKHPSFGVLGNVNAISSTDVLNTPVVVTGQFDDAANTNAVRINGGAATSAAQASSLSANVAFYLASRFDAFAFAQIDLAEVLVYNSSLSTGNRQSVERYLGTKYGITVA